MQESELTSENFFKTACIFEGVLLILALIFGWLADVDPLAQLKFSESALANGILATLPLLVMFFAMQQLQNPAIQNINKMLLETLGKHLSQRHWTDLFILASIAGVSEEVLFRGFLQPWLENLWDTQLGLLVSNVLFALVHALTPLYALLALLIGLYLGIMLDYQGERNLLLPIIIHALYDFVAFMVILRNYRKQVNV